MSLYGPVDALRYLVIAGLWVLAGCAVVGLLGIRTSTAARWRLAPAATLALLATILGIAAAQRIPLYRVVPGVWLLVVGLALVALWRERPTLAALRHGDPSTRAEAGLLLALAIVAPALLLAPFFTYGFGSYRGSDHLDGWSYAMYAAYLHDYPRATAQDLQPGYQWAAHLSIGRHASASLLAWLSPATGEGDTAAARPLLLALATFSIASSCATVARRVGLPRRLALLAAVGAAAGNWIANAVLVWNLDNLLALSYLPALAALAMDEEAWASPRPGLLAGLFVAAALYTYPELSPITFACAACFLLPTIWRIPVRRSLAAVVLGALTAAILMAPYARELTQYFGLQLGLVGLTPPRPGDGSFPGLVDPAVRLPSLWALGAESGVRPLPYVDVAVAVLLSLLAMLGLVQLVRRRVAAPVVSVGLIGAALGVMLLRFEYPYGSFKLLLQGWWLWTLAVAIGVRVCADWDRRLGVAAAGIALATVVVTPARSARQIVTRQADMRPMRALSDIESRTGGAPIALLVKDWPAAHWAAYFLRHHETQLVAAPGYLGAPHLRTLMVRAKAIPWETLHVVLTDSRDPGPIVAVHDWKRLWRNPVYALWDSGDLGWAAIHRDEGAYGGTADQFAVGETPTSLVAGASEAGALTVRALVRQHKTSRAKFLGIRTAEETGARCHVAVPPEGGSTTWSLPIRRGQNVFSVTTWTTGGAVPPPPGADTIALIIEPRSTFTRGGTASCSIDSSAVPPGAAMNTSYAGAPQ